ncbi:gastrula zinc finger protein XlCGF48.2-like isoform X2 [Hyperolius riggenbachi]|uniref:gastrula zinc finger protein XlCGF48.2-like isoform X2 n=1 Tax=Hyperolius riggenbachi TaxID=752182 RepID=UPI0035A2DA01
MPICIVSNCPSKSNKSTYCRGVMLHAFPTDITRIKRWLLQTGQDFGKIDEFAEMVYSRAKTSAYRLCSQHFTPNCYTLKKTLKNDAVPTLFSHQKVLLPPLSKKGTGKVKGKDDDHLLVEKDISNMSMLDLILEVIYLLTGEDCLVLKKPSGRALTAITVPPRPTLTSKRYRKILQVIKKMTELLKGEDGKNLGGKNPYKDVKSKNQQPVTAPDGSNNRNPSETHSGPLYSLDSPTESYNIPQHYQNIDQINVKEEEEEMYVDGDGSFITDPQDQYTGPFYSQDSSEEHYRFPHCQQMDTEDEALGYEMDDEPWEEEEILSEISPDTGVTEDVKLEEEESLVVIKEEELPVEISTDTGVTQDIKDEEEESLVVIKEEELPAEISRDTRVTEDVKDEEEESLVMIKEEELPAEICTGGEKSSNTSEGHSFCLSECKREDCDMTADPVAPELSVMNPSPNLSTHGHLPDPTQAGTPSNTQGPSSLFNCTGCRKWFLLKLPIDQYQKLSTGSIKFICPNCGQCTLQNMGVPQANTVDDVRDKILTCSDVQSSPQTVAAPGHQINQTEEEGPNHSGHEETCLGEAQSSAHKQMFKCSECSRCFTRRQALQQHERIHTGEKPFLCSECGKCFTHDSSLMRHRKGHAGIKPFLCTECGKSFSLKENLTSHMKIHLGGELFPCFECGKLFKYKSYLVDHHRIHTGEKLFSCSQCGRRFSTRNVLRRHEQQHTSKKSLSCPICEKCFSNKPLLRSHQWHIHTEDKPFPCSECGKRFVTEFHLLRHQKSHSAEKQFSCPKCQRGFKHKSDLARHQRNHACPKMSPQRWREDVRRAFRFFSRV